MGYAEKKEARIERYRARAGKAEANSEQLHLEAKAMQDVIPFGQPILVDHYSAKRHRSHIAKTQRKYEQCWAEQEKADYYHAKAEAAERNTAIYSDDEQAIQKLEKKIAAAEAGHADMVRVNKYYRKHGTLVGCDGIAEESAREMDAELKAELDNRLKYNPKAKTQPFASFQLSNSSARIRNDKQRLEQLKKLAERETVESQAADGIIYKENAEDNRVQLIFDGKPEVEVRQILKSHGFRWSPRAGAWQRHLNNSGIYAAKMVLKKLEELN